MRRAKGERTPISVRLSVEATSALDELAAAENTTRGIAARGVLERALRAGEHSIQQSLDIAAVLAELFTTVESLCEAQVKTHKLLRHGLETVLLNVAPKAQPDDVREWLDRQTEEAR